MARLYGVLRNVKGTEVHKTADTAIIVEVFYGSKEHSKKYLSLVVQWNRGDSKPHIEWFVTPDLG